MIPLRRFFFAASIAAMAGCGLRAAQSSSTQLVVAPSPPPPRQRPRVDCSTITAAPSSRRILISAAGHFTHLSDITCPGYYTVVAFSSPGCAPCEQLWQESLHWLNTYANVLFVDVDLGLEDGPQFQLPLDLEFKGQAVPVGILIGPFGQLMARAPDATQIRAVFAKLEKRRYKEPILELVAPPAVVTPLPVGGAVSPSREPVAVPPEPALPDASGTAPIPAPSPTSTLSPL